MVAVPARVVPVVAGGGARSGDFNSVASVGNLGLYDRPICKAIQTSFQSLSTGGNNGITFDTTLVDNDGMRSGANSLADRMVCRTQGWWLVTGTVAYAATGGSSGVRMSFVYVNGVAVDGGASTSFNAASNTMVTCTTLVHLNVGDFLQLVYYQDSGATINSATSPAGQRTALAAIFMMAG